jgi:hypothetical protein
MLAGFRAYADKVTGSKEVRAGPCVTSIAGPNGAAQLYER